MSTYTPSINRKVFFLGIILLAMMGYAIFFTPIIDAQSAPITTLTTDHDFNGVSWSPDGELIAVGSFEGTRIYDTDLQEVTLLTGVPIISVDWNSDSTMLASAGGFGEGEGRVQVWERDVTTNDFELIAELSNGMFEEFFVKWSPDGTKLASIGSIYNQQLGSSVDTFEIWNTDTWDLDNVLDRLYYDATYVLGWSPDSQLILGGGKQFIPSLEVYQEGYFIANTETGEQLFFFEFFDGSIPALGWSPQGDRIVTSGSSSLSIYDPATGNLVNSLEGYALELAWRPSGSWVAVKTFTDISIRNMDTGDYALTLETNEPIFSFAWSPDGTRIVTTTGIGEGTLEIWDVSNLPDWSGTPTLTPLPTNTPTPTPSPLMPSGSD